MALVNFKQSTEAKIKSAPMADGTFYVSTDTNKLFLDISNKRVEISANTNTTYTLTKSGNTITLNASDGNKYNITDANTTYGDATTVASGLMSAADKAKLDGIAAQANKVVVDASLSDSSTNPVQNKVIKAALDGKAPATHGHGMAQISGLNEALAGKAPISHTHTTAQVSGLDTALAGKAPTNHNHNGVYAPVNHTHDQGVAYVAEKSTAGERYVKIMDYLCDTSYRRVNQQFILAGRQDAILLTVQIATTDSKKIVYKDLTYLPLSQGYNDIISRLFAGIIAISAEQDRFELWYKQGQWNTSINIIPLGKNYEGTRLNLFSYNDKVAGETKLPAFATQITLKRHTHSISEITDIANANTNSAKFIRDSQDSHSISLSYAESETKAAEFLPVFKDRNTIGNMKLTTLRGAIGAAPATHNHPTSQITGLDTALASKANTAHNHDAANIISGVLNVDRVPSIPATKLTGIINQANLPSYVDDVLEFANKTAFPTKGESGKIYVDQATNITYRWGGTAYVEISPSLALGTTSSTAFRGDYGNTAYQHAVAKGSAFAHGMYKITTNSAGHVTAAQAITKSDITALGIPAQDTNTWIAMKGASASAAGGAGYVPAPTTGQQNLFLRGDGTWAQGPVGPKGDKGATGERGPQGIQGIQGATGATPVITASATVGNTTGTPSVQVVKGGTTTNPTFAFNFTNLKGAQGPQGIQGIQGPKGDKGLTGDRGATGERGPQGATGAAATIKVGTVSTGNPGTNATVVNAGTANAAVFDFTIPRGATGATGPQGPAGAKGATGDTGPQGPAGARGATGERGPAGANGTSAAWHSGTLVTGTSTSAITVAVSGSKAGDMYLNTSTSNVYKATAANSWVYVCNIKGATGATGATGSAGPQGIQGPQGVQGPAGPAGAKGATGATGPAGPQGPQGPAGVGLAEIAVQSSQPTASNIKLWIKV